MRISTFAITVSVAVGSLMALPALTNAAYAVQDQPVTIGGVQSVCTGVGSAKDNPDWKNYPIKLTFSTWRARTKPPNMSPSPRAESPSWKPIATRPGC
jgi:hypothetical protein